MIASHLLAGLSDKAAASEHRLASRVSSDAAVHVSIGAALFSSGSQLVSLNASAAMSLMQAAQAALTRALAIDDQNAAAHLQLMDVLYSASLAQRYGGGVNPATRPSAMETHARLIRVLREAARHSALLCTSSPPWALLDPAGAHDPKRLITAAEAAGALRMDGRRQDGEESALFGSWLANWDQLAAVQRALRSHRPFTIRSAFSAAFARRVQAVLNASTTEWACTSKLDGDGFWMRRCVASPPSAELEAVLAPLHAPPFRRLVAALTGQPVGTYLYAEATEMRVNDFLTLHDDSLPNRQVAFAWHLHDDWRRGDGGELAAVCPLATGERFIPPHFNSLTLLRVHGREATSTHAVLPVLRDRGTRRLAVSGWFMDGAPPQCWAGF